jgi:hypothetical protein
MTLSLSDAKKISICDYLSKLGFSPTRVRGNDHWYRSPLRHERDASFKVDNKFNLWYDHGLGEGGTLLDLGIKLHQCSLPEFIEKLSKENYSLNTVNVSQQRQQPESKIEVIAVTGISDQTLTQYLHDRAISMELANRYCKQIDFEMNNRKYLAIGFANRSGGYELRNTWFKGSSSPKDVTTIHNGRSSVCITEGFFDFLSLQQEDRPEIKQLRDKSDFLILNSIAFMKKSLSIIGSYDKREVFLDNDEAAQKAKELLRENGFEFNDRSGLYAPFKDLNEHLIKSKSDRQTLTKSRAIRP